MPLSRDFLKTWGESWWHHAPRELVALYESGVPSPERTEIVVMQKVLADRVNQGYHEVANVVIEKVDGCPVRSLSHLVAMVDRENANAYVRFDTSDGEQIVLDRREVRERQAAVLERFGVPHDRAPQLRLPVPAPFQPAALAPLAAG